MQNPFTTTYSKVPENTYIFTEEVSEMTENFSYDNPSESVYKITGVRGSGKTVILSKIEEELQNKENEKRGWIVCRVSPNRDMLMQFGSILSKHGFDSAGKKINGVSVSANVLGAGGSVNFSAANDIKDIGVEIEEMIKFAQKKGKKLLIGVDEISKTKAVVDFVAEFGKWLRANYPVYFVCTGLYENIQEVANVKNLTFFRRATTIQTSPLNQVKMTETYKEKLGVDSIIARKMAECTGGYAYAFQQLGVIAFKELKKDNLDDVLRKLKIELFSYSYEKIWEELSENDKLFLRQITDNREYKREEIITSLGESAGIYSVYRDRLIKRGIINTRYSYVSLALPFFGEYIKEYCV